MTEKKFNDYEPLYLQVSESIKDNIHNGNFVRGAKLPNEEVLARELEVSRGTIRKSLSVLNEEGYIETLHGKGSFVKNEVVSSPIAQQYISFEEDMAYQNLDFTTKVLSKKVIIPDDTVQYALKLESKSEVLFLERLRTVKDKPSILLYNWIPLERCPGIDKYDFEAIGLFKAMEETMGKRIVKGVREFSALNANEHIQEILELKNDAVLRITQTSFNQMDIPIEYSDVYLRTDKYQVISFLQR